MERDLEIEHDLYDEDEKRPALRWETGEPLSDGATEWMWAQLARVSKTSYRRLLASVYDVWRRVDDRTRYPDRTCST